MPSLHHAILEGGIDVELFNILKHECTNAQS
jgi:hypothetical protein